MKNIIFILVKQYNTDDTNICVKVDAFSNLADAKAELKQAENDFIENYKEYSVEIDYNLYDEPNHTYLYTTEIEHYAYLDMRIQKKVVKTSSKYLVNSKKSVTFAS